MRGRRRPADTPPAHSSESGLDLARKATLVQLDNKNPVKGGALPDDLYSLKGQVTKRVC
jgi:hypothetical protein